MRKKSIAATVAALALIGAPAAIATGGEAGVAFLYENNVDGVAAAALAESSNLRGVLAGTVDTSLTTLALVDLDGDGNLESSVDIDGDGDLDRVACWVSVGPRSSERPVGGNFIDATGEDRFETARLSARALESCLDGAGS